MPGNKPVVIHRATPDQAEILTEIAFAAKRHWGYPERWIEIWSPLLTISPEFIEQHETYVVNDEKPVGFYAISIEKDKANLEHLWLLPDYMGQGIGAMLFQHALERCKELGARILEIESDPNAKGFYECMGARMVREHISNMDGQVRTLPVLEITLT
jgi:GNAT superfamily N-acetyltransferase